MAAEKLTMPHKVKLQKQINIMAKKAVKSKASKPALKKAAPKKAAAKKK
jgi:hypothetical protein